MSRSNSNGIALVKSVDFFHAFMGFLASEVTAESILSRITGIEGVVDLSPMNQQ